MPSGISAGQPKSVRAWTAGTDQLFHHRQQKRASSRPPRGLGVSSLAGQLGSGSGSSRARAHPSAGGGAPSGHLPAASSLGLALAPPDAPKVNDLGDPLEHVSVGDLFAGNANESKNGV